MTDLPPLRRIHSDAVLHSRRYRGSLEYWRMQSTQAIIESLAPGHPMSLVTFPDGRIKNGNTRIFVLQERGVDVDSLPREVDHS